MLFIMYSSLAMLAHHLSNSEIYATLSYKPPDSSEKFGICFDYDPVLFYFLLWSVVPGALHFLSEYVIINERANRAASQKGHLTSSGFIVIPPAI